jgi:hypothetical protein
MHLISSMDNLSGNIIFRNHNPQRLYVKQLISRPLRSRRQDAKSILALPFFAPWRLCVRISPSPKSSHETNFLTPAPLKAPRRKEYFGPALLCAFASLREIIPFLQIFAQNQFPHAHPTQDAKKIWFRPPLRLCVFA